MADPVQQGEERPENLRARDLRAFDSAEIARLEALEGVELRETERWTLDCWRDESEHTAYPVVSVVSGPEFTGSRDVVPAEHLVAERARADEAVRERDVLKALLVEFASHRADSSIAWLDDWTHRAYEVVDSDPSARASSHGTGRECSSSERIREKLQAEIHQLVADGVLRDVDAHVFRSAVDEVLGGDER